MEFLDKSFEQYNASQFKAYFGIGNSLVKRVNEDPNQVKEKEININKLITLNICIKGPK